MMDTIPFVVIVSRASFADVDNKVSILISISVVWLSSLSMTGIELLRTSDRMLNPSDIIMFRSTAEASRGH